MSKKINKKLIIYIWLSLLVLGLLAYIIFPDTFSLSALISLIRNNYWLAITIYFLIICFRGLLLISPLSVTLAGTVFFPPLTVFLINTFGILISSTLIYKFSEYLGFDRYFEKKYQARLEKLKSRLDKKEVPIILTWAFLPLFPTDLITYLSATLKVKIWKCLLGIFIGTAVINAIFIYSLNFFLPTAANLDKSPTLDPPALYSTSPLPAEPIQND